MRKLGPFWRMLHRLGFEVYPPSRESLWGFIIAWLCVLAILLFTVWLARLGG